MLFISHLSNTSFLVFYLENIDHRCMVDDNSIYWPGCKSDKHGRERVCLCVRACVCVCAFKNVKYTDQNGNTETSIIL